MNYFPDCEILNCEQRSDIWFEARRGILTASTLGAWIMSKKTARDKSARETAICKLVAQTANAWEKPNFESPEMTRGTELEGEAVASFERFTGKTVQEVGFCRSIHGLFGCSPDGLIVGESCGLEGKVPIPGTHIRYRRANELPKEYMLQVHSSMATTGAESWWFQAYNPGLAGFRILVERSDFTNDLLGAMREFSGELEAALAEEAIAWDREFGKGDS